MTQDMPLKMRPSQDIIDSQDSTRIHPLKTLAPAQSVLLPP